MTNNNRGLLVKIPSAMFATLLLFAITLLFLNKLSIWAKIGSVEHFWTLFAVIYIAVLTTSGWLFVLFKGRVTGFIHAGLMLGIAGMVFYGIMRGMVTSPGSDNAAAGIVAGANFLFILLGLFTTICGVTVMMYLFSEKEDSKKPH